MSDSRSLSPVEASEYERIEAAMSESARGRRFLAEYARRNRSADTDMLLQAIARLENAVSSERGSDEAVQMRGDLMEMAEAISRTRAEISAIHAPDQDQTRLGVASEALDAIVRATEQATSDILGAAEEVQEAAWTLRERGVETEICDGLDRHATQIYTACSFQDLTAQRTGRVVNTLRYLEERIASMIAIWGKRLDAVPPAPGSDDLRAGAEAANDLCQSDVDRFLASETHAAPQPAARAPLAGEDDVTVLRGEPVSEPDAAAPDSEPVAETPDEKPVPKAESEDDLALAFVDFDKLSIEEKIALFS